MKKIILISLGLTLNVLIAAAQQKVKDGTVNNDNLLNKDAILELESSNKGLLHTRVALRLTTDVFPGSSLATNWSLVGNAGTDRTNADFTPINIFLQG